MNHASVVDNAVMEKFFRSHSELLENTKRVLNVKIFRHDPAHVISHTAILVKYEIEIETSTGQREIIILRGSSDTHGNRRKSYYILQELHRRGFAEGPLLVPKPLGYFEDLHLLLYKNLPGPSLMQEFERGEGKYGEKIEKCVDWLIKFHSTKLSNLPKIYYAWDDEVAKFRHLEKDLVKKFGHLQGRITAAVSALADNEKKLLQPEKFTLVHGDFQPNNILMQNGQTAVIDFNDAFFYDELFDIVYFKIQTRFMLQRLGRQARDAELEKTFQRYLKTCGIVQDGLVEKKIALFTAKTLLRIKVLTSHELGSRLLEQIEAYVQKTI